MLESYTYDANGNRGGRTYADDDRMTGTHVYDAAGFLVSRGADTFSYADRGQLKTATVGGQKVDYEYDASAAARRARRRRRAHGVPLRRSGRPFRVTASRVGGELTQYFYDRGGLLIALERGGARYYVGTDQVGTPRVITDADGRGGEDLLDQRVRRAQQGAPRPARSSSRSGSRAASRTRSPGSCASACATTSRPRAASPRATRSCTRAGINLYVYAGNDPVSKRDPSGMDEGGGAAGASAASPARHLELHRRQVQQARRVGPERGRPRRDRDGRRAPARERVSDAAGNSPTA